MGEQFCTYGLLSVDNANSAISEHSTSEDGSLRPPDSGDLALFYTENKTQGDVGSGPRLGSNVDRDLSALEADHFDSAANSMSTASSTTAEPSSVIDSHGGAIPKSTAAGSILQMTGISGVSGTSTTTTITSVAMTSGPGGRCVSTASTLGGFLGGQSAPIISPFAQGSRTMPSDSRSIGSSSTEDLCRELLSRLQGLGGVAEGGNVSPQSVVQGGGRTNPSDYVSRAGTQVRMQSASNFSAHNVSVAYRPGVMFPGNSAPAPPVDSSVGECSSIDTQGDSRCARDPIRIEHVLDWPDHRNTDEPSGFEHVNQRTIRAAINGEFVDLNELLSHKSDIHSELQSKINEEITLKVRSGKTGNNIRGIVSWCEAWSIYERIMCYYHGPKAYREMSKYRSWILDLAQERKAPYILNYDENHRRRLSYVRSVRFHSFNHDLYVRIFDGNSFKSAGRCQRCAGSDHGTQDCPYVGAGSSPSNFKSQEAFRGKAGPGTRRNQEGVGQDPEAAPCIMYNRGTCRFGNRCRRRHVCIVCDRPEPVTECQHCRGRGGAPSHAGRDSATITHSHQGAGRPSVSGGRLLEANAPPGI